MKRNYKTPAMPITFSLPIIAIQVQAYDCDAENNQFRNDKKAWIAASTNSPLSSSDMDHFDDLHYYPINNKLVMPGTLNPATSENAIDIATNKGGIIRLFDAGTVNVNIGSEQYQLQAYKNIDMPEFDNMQESIFIPIKDGTSGPAPKTTFDHGRYLLIRPPASGNQIMLDFNMIINPFENYNSNFSTLLVPASNTILAPIMSGERKYEDR
ncbi:MAG: DUF1684 domain-containing protein [Bacteroidota bacterium]